MAHSLGSLVLVTLVVGISTFETIPKLFAVQNTKTSNPTVTSVLAARARVEAPILFH